MSQGSISYEVASHGGCSDGCSDGYGDGYGDGYSDGFWASEPCFETTHSSDDGACSTTIDSGAGDMTAVESSGGSSGRAKRATARKVDRSAGVGAGTASNADAAPRREPVRRGGTTEMRIMQSLMGLTVAAGALAFAPNAEGAIVAFWSMNGVAPATSTAQAADIGTGSVQFGAVASGASTLLGTTLGAPEGVLAGDSLSIAGMALNGQAIELVFDATSWGDLSLSFATRRSSTGFASTRLEWWDGLGWTTVEKFTASTTAWEVKSFDLAALDGLEDRVSRLRIVLDGATGSTGSMRFDNFTVAGSAVPAPAGAIALLALAGCAARRRR
jgi:hypothetical protein